METEIYSKNNCRVCGINLTKKEKMGIYCRFCYVLVSEKLISFDPIKISALTKNGIVEINFTSTDRRETLKNLFNDYTDYCN